MNKTAAVCLVAALILSSSILVSTSSALNFGSLNVASSGSITYMQLKNAIVIYGWDSLDNSQIKTIANNFDLLICDSAMSSSSLASLKALNPNILIFGYCNLISASPSNSYWSTVNANENWFMHDVNGSRISLPQYNWYLMNISSPGWQQFYSSYVNGYLKNSLFSGLFADDGWSQLYLGQLIDASTGAILTRSDISSSAISNWPSNMISFLQYVKGNIVSGKQVIVNTGDLTGSYLSAVDGKMNEGYAINDPAHITTYINAMTKDSATGKIFISENNVGTATPAEIAQKATFSYAATLLGMDGPNCYFGVNYGGSNGWYTFDGGADYMPTTINVGTPINSFYQSQGVYMRNFTNGIVLCNPSNAAQNVSLGNSYRLLNGTIVSNLILGSWSGEILLSK